MSIEKILVLESETVLRQQLVHQLQERRLEVVAVPTFAAASEWLARDEFELMIANVSLLDGASADLFQQARQRPARPLVVVISAFGSVETAVDAVRQGAFGFLLQPFSSAQLDAMLQRAADYLQLVRVSQLLSRELDADGGWELLGESNGMRQLRQTIRQVARTEATVLVSGESGTGKERVARALYQQSLRSHAPLIKANCADTPAPQLEAELFGQQKAGGVKRPGRFELAHGGTLLLDEIAEISPAVQTRLWRVLQDQTLERVGGSRPIKVDVRVLTTTSRNLEDKVHRQEFREDLFFRLNIVPVIIPPLRERREDLPLLAEYFRERFARRHHSPALAIAPACLAALQSYPWPGNVRELKNVMEHAVLVCREGNVLEPRHLDLTLTGGQPIAAPPPPSPLLGSESDALDAIEQKHILAVLEKCHNNRTHAAKRLGISIRTLRNKLKKYRTEAEARADGTETPAESA